MPSFQSGQSSEIFKGQTGWTQYDQSYTSQIKNSSSMSYLPNRFADDFSAPLNQSRKRIHQDQDGETFSLLVKRHRKGIGYQQQTPTVSNSMGFSSLNTSHPLPLQKTSSPCCITSEYVQDDHDVSVTPRLAKHQEQTESSIVPGKHLNRQTAVRVIVIVATLACKIFPNLKTWFLNERKKHNIVCLSEQLSANLLVRLKMPRDRKVLQFYMHHRSTICKLANEGRCPKCNSEFRSANSGISQHIDSRNTNSCRNVPKSTSSNTRCFEENKYYLLAAAPSTVMKVGQNVSRHTTQNNGNACNAQLPESSRKWESSPKRSPFGLNDEANLYCPEITNTLVSKSVLKDGPYSAKTFHDGCQRVDLQRINVSNSPLPPQGLPVSTSNSVLNQQSARNHSITTNTEPIRQECSTAHALGNNPSVTSAQGFANSTAQTMNLILPKRKVNSYTPSPQNRNHKSTTVSNLNRNAGNKSVKDLLHPSATHLIYQPNQPLHKQRMGSLQVPAPGSSSRSTVNPPRTTAQPPTSTYSTKTSVFCGPPPQHPAIDRSTNLSEGNKTSTLLQMSSSTFRQQAAWLMKLPESINTSKEASASSAPPAYDIMSCFSLKPKAGTKVSQQSTSSRRFSNESSSGMILPHRIKSECIVLEDSDTEDHPISEAPVVNTFSDTSTGINEIAIPKHGDFSQAQEGSFLSSDPLTINSSSNISESINESSKPIVNGSTTTNKTSASVGHNSEEPEQRCVLPYSRCPQSTNRDKRTTETSPEKLDNIPMNEAFKQLEDDTPLNSMLACPEAKFTTFMFDGAGDMEITTAEFGEKEWEQLMRG